jgi:hypothetical protein
MDRQVWTSQDRKNLSEQGALTHWRAWTDKLEYEKNMSEKGALTNWRAQMKGQLRT